MRRAWGVVVGCALFWNLGACYPERPWGHVAAPVPERAACRPSTCTFVVGEVVDHRGEACPTDVGVVKLGYMNGPHTFRLDVAPADLVAATLRNALEVCGTSGRGGKTLSVEIIDFRVWEVTSFTTEEIFATVRYLVDVGPNASAPARTFDVHGSGRNRHSTRRCTHRT